MLTTLVQDIQGLIAESTREIVIAHISHTQNKVAHGLAAYGRCTPPTPVWFGSGTSEVVSLCMADSLP